MAQALNTNLVTLSWQDESAGKATYRIYRESVLIAEVSGSSYTDNSVTASTQYTYQVQAVDTSVVDNLSALSNVAAVTTPAMITQALGRCSVKRFA